MKTRPFFASYEALYKDGKTGVFNSTFEITGLFTAYTIRELEKTQIEMDPAIENVVMTNFKELEG
jgi:hypothetical protein